MRFFFVVLGIKHLVRNTCVNQHLRNQVRCFNGNRTNKNWLTLIITTLNILYHSTEFSIQSWVQKVIMVNTLNWTVCWNWDDSHVIDFTEFILFSLTSTSHTWQFLVHTEHILVSDWGRCLRFFLNWHTFFCLNGLVEPIWETTSFHGTTCKLVDDKNFLLRTYHIVDIMQHDVVGTKGIVNIVSQGNVVNIIQVVQVEEFFSLVNTWVIQTNCFCWNINRIIIFSQCLNKSIRTMIQLISFWTYRTWYNQWCTSFIDKNRVNLIDQGIVQWTLYHVFLTNNHVITKIVETYLWVGWVSDVTIISFTFFSWWFGWKVNPYWQTKPTIKLTHFSRITLWKVFVNGDNVYTFTWNSIQVDRHCRSKGFPFPCTHLRYVTMVKHNTTHNLHTIWEKSKDTFRSLTNNRKCLRQELI